MRHRPWMSTAAYIGGLAALVNLVVTPSAHPWIPWILVLMTTGAITISVGYHRLFCHASFPTHKFWHWLFATTGVLYLLSSPLQWTVTHATHHRWSDTDRDPHPEPLRAMFTKSYRKVPLDLWKAKRLIRQNRWHLFVDKHYANIWLVLVSLAAAISWEFVLYAYFPALGIAHFIGSLHNTLSHVGGKPRDWWFLEFILPAGGEWLHARHHKYERLPDYRYRWYHFDLGALFIKLIRTRT